VVVFIDFDWVNAFSKSFCFDLIVGPEISNATLLFEQTTSKEDICASGASPRRTETQGTNDHLRRATGFTAAELQKSGKAYDHWPVIEKAWWREQKRRSRLRKRPNRSCVREIVGELE